MVEVICINIMLLSIWFLTEWRAHVYNTIKKTDFTGRDFDSHLALNDIHLFKSDFTLGGLLTCPFCLGFWVAGISSLIFGLSFPIIYVSQMAGFLIIKKIR